MAGGGEPTPVRCLWLLDAGVEPPAPPVPPVGRQRRPRLRHGIAGAGVLLVVLGLGGALAPLAVAGSEARTGGFVATAIGQGARVTYTVPNFLILETLADGGGPVSQAVVDSAGNSRSFASMPYPGDTVIGGPGVLCAGTGQCLPAGYPLYASAEYPFAPEGKVEEPSGQYKLEAAAPGPDDARAVARSALGTADAPASGTRSEAVVEVGDDGTVTAVAETLAAGLSFGDGALRIASVRSRSTSVLDPASTRPTTKHELVIDGATVSGVGVAIGPEGISALGQPVPVPADTTRQLDQALGQAGLSVRTVKSDEVVGGGSADALEVVSRQKLPVPGEPEGSVVLRFGGAITSIVAGEGAALEVPEVPDVPVGPFGTGAATQAGSGGTAAPGGGGEAGAAPAAALPGPAGGGTGGTGRTDPGGGLVALARDLRGTTQVFYLVIAVGGALLLASSSVWRTKGVRSPWTS